MVFVTWLLCLGLALGLSVAFVALARFLGSLGIFGFVVVLGVLNFSGGLSGAGLSGGTVEQFLRSGRDKLFNQ